MTEPKPDYTAKPKIIALTVFGEPVPKARARVAQRGTRRWAYTPPRTSAWEQEIAVVYRQARGPMFTGSVILTAHFYRKSRRRADLDNFLKAVLDGLNGVAWTDDSQVRRIEAELHRDDDPRVEIRITGGAG